MDGCENSSNCQDDRGFIKPERKLVIASAVMAVVAMVTIKAVVAIGVVSESTCADRTTKACTAAN